LPGPEDPYDANSPARWERRFASGEWASDGKFTTAAFGDVLVRHLSPRAREVLSTFGVTVLDWGCAFGELAERVKREFPNAVVVGQDWAPSAIEYGKRHFPLVDFQLSHDQRVDIVYDVTISSNVYEHIPDYHDSLRHLLAHTSKLHIVLVPFNEWLGDEAESLPDAAAREAQGWTHVHRFLPPDFPPIRPFFTQHVDITLTPGPAWPGKQMLVEYHREKE
jgi:SAM-dependent methyltransferase